MACNNYRLDMTAATFGVCVCGYKKTDHANPNPSFARPRGLSSGRSFSCAPAPAPAPASSSSDSIEERWDEQYQQTYYLDTVTGESGWTRDGLHPNVWVYLRYFAVSANVLADFGEACRPGVVR